MFEPAISRPSMRFFVSRMEDDKEPVLAESEVVNFRLANVQLSFRATENVGSGELIVTSSRVMWIGQKRAFDFDVQYIVLHAITKDQDSFPLPCLYCQFDDDSFEDEEMEEEDEQGKISRGGDIGNWIKRCQTGEMFLAPSDENELRAVFDAFSQAALLNPDEEEDEGEGNDGFIFNAEEVELGAQQAKALDHLESVFVLPGEE